MKVKKKGFDDKLYGARMVLNDLQEKFIEIERECEKGEVRAGAEEDYNSQRILYGTKRGMQLAIDCVREYRKMLSEVENEE